MKAIATKLLLVAVIFTTASAAPAKGDDFNSVVKMIEAAHLYARVLLCVRREGRREDKKYGNQ